MKYLTILVTALCFMFVVSTAEAKKSGGSKKSYSTHKSAGKRGGSSGCGSKGGPGYRKSNGKCASWKD